LTTLNHEGVNRAAQILFVDLHVKAGLGEAADP
jgi:prepilin-type processing-associated H-X9-DG protein